MEKIAQIFEKVAKIVAKPKIAYVSYVIHKVQNVYIKPLMKPKIPTTNSTLQLFIKVKINKKLLSKK
jgi:hypothetical protein